MCLKQNCVDVFRCLRFLDRFRDLNSDIFPRQLKKTNV